jgi:hypothetical protein
MCVAAKIGKHKEAPWGLLACSYQERKLLLSAFCGGFFAAL